MERFSGTNYIQSVGIVNEQDQQARYEDLQFMVALVALMEKFPYLTKSLPYILRGTEPSK